MEEVLLTHKDLIDCAVVSQNDNLKGEVPVGFICIFLYNFLFIN